jgi:hypothetical protein
MPFRAAKIDTELLYLNLELIASPETHPDDDVMQWISEYLCASYFMSINPLVGIRKVLPQYYWAFHRVKSYEASRKVTRQSDFIWCTNAFGGAPDNEIELVTATLLESRDALRLFYAGIKYASLGDALTWEIKLAQDCGGEPEYTVIINK